MQIKLPFLGFVRINSYQLVRPPPEASLFRYFHLYYEGVVNNTLHTAVDIVEYNQNMGLHTAGILVHCNT